MKKKVKSAKKMEVGKFDKTCRNFDPTFLRWKLTELQAPPEKAGLDQNFEGSKNLQFCKYGGAITKFAVLDPRIWGPAIIFPALCPYHHDMLYMLHMFLVTNFHIYGD